MDMASPVFSVAASQGCPNKVGREATDTCTVKLKNQVCNTGVVYRLGYKIHNSP